MVYTRLSYQEYPYLPLQPWRRTSREGVPANLPIPSLIPLQDFTGPLPATFEDEVQGHQQKQLTVLDNTNKNHNHNDNDGYIIPIRTQVDNIH